MAEIESWEDYTGRRWVSLMSSKNENVLDNMVCKIVDLLWPKSSYEERHNHICDVMVIRNYDSTINVPLDRWMELTDHERNVIESYVTGFIDGSE